MPGRVKLMKTKWYPRPHEISESFFLSAEIATGATIIPLMFYDEGLGTPSDEDTHPEHASFTQALEANCFPQSRVDSIFAQLQVSLTKGAFETDKVQALKYAFMPIFIAFKEPHQATDEKTTQSIDAILELQIEDTDRQAYPLYNGTKVAEKYSGSATLPANQPGLTTTQVLEYVAFTGPDYYRALHYYTISELLKRVQGGLKWNIIKKQSPVHTIKLRLRRKSKNLLPYGFYGVLVWLPQVDTTYQLPVSGDTTAIPHLTVSVMSRYNEWNPDFNFKRV